MNKKNSVSIEAARIQSYKLPVYKKGAQHYVEFYAFNPLTGKLGRRKKMFDYIKNIKERNKAAEKFCKEITYRLQTGWNPWVEETCDGEYAQFAVVCDKYEEFLMKMLNEGQYREDTIVGYRSKLKILKEWLATRTPAIYFAFQFDRKIICQFLDYIFIDRNTTVRTRNNYLNWLSTFGTYLVQRQFVSKDPTEGIERIRYNHPKNRSVIPASQLNDLSIFLNKNNKHFLLACHLIYYLFIRPKEMSNIRLKDINIKDCTIRIWGEYAKNHKDAVLTMPKKVLKLMLELDTFSHPGTYYLFSDGFMPGPAKRSEKSFRDYWHRYIKEEFKYPDTYKFYSLKDTGITTMLKNNTDIITVRDQARHSSIKITDIYTPHDIVSINDVILNYEGDL